MILSSPQFADGAILPFQCSYEAENHSPALRWDEVPKMVVSYALICVDTTEPAAPWIHWMIWNIPGTTTQLPESMEQFPKLEDGSCQGRNSYHEIGWGGPCPPDGIHFYEFELFALDTFLPDQIDTISELYSAMQGHVMETAKLTACSQAERPVVSWEKLREGRGAFNGI